MAQKESEVMITPAIDRQHVDVRDEVDDVEREPTSAEDDDHGHAQSVVLPLPLILGLLFGRRLSPGPRPRVHPLRQASHDKPSGRKMASNELRVLCTVIIDYRTVDTA